MPPTHAPLATTLVGKDSRPRRAVLDCRAKLFCRRWSSSTSIPSPAESRRWPAGRQTASVQFAAAAARLIELIRISEGAIATSVADLHAEAETGLWSAVAVEALLAPGVVFAPLDAPAVEATPERPDGSKRELHEAQPLLGPHTMELEPAHSEQAFTSVQFVSASSARNR